MELKMLPQYPSTLWALSSWRTISVLALQPV